MPPYPAFRAFRFLAMVVAISCSSLGAAGQVDGFPLVTSYSGDDIGANPISWIVVQDRNGVLHFGARELVSFDGDRWRSTAINGANVIRGLDFSVDGSRLWAGAIGEIGWFERAENRDLNYRSLGGFVPSGHKRFGEVRHVFAEPDGALFITDETIMRWDGNALRVWSLPGPRHLRALRSEGGIYVQHRLTGLYRMTGSGPELFLPVSILGEKGVFWLESRSSGRFVVTNEGIFLLSHGQLQPIQPESSKRIKEGVPTHVIRMDDGRFAISTMQDGIIILHPDGSLDRVLGPEDGLPTRLITQVFVDRDQQLWATSFTHICRISVASPSTLFDSRSSLPNKPFYRISGNAENLFAATDDSVYSLTKGSSRFVPFEPLNELVSGLSQSTSGLLAAGVRAVKLVNANGVSIVHSTAYDTFVAQAIDDGRILVADGRRVVVADQKGGSKVLVADLPENAWSLARDRNGRIWMGTWGHGIYFARPEGTTAAFPQSAAPMIGRAETDGIGIVREMRDGSVCLFFSNEAWLTDGDATPAFQAVENYPRRTLIAASEATTDGTVWLVHSGGGLAPCVGAVSFSAGQAEWRSHSVEGLPSIGTPQTIFAQQAEPNTTILWIGGSSGILRHVVSHGPTAPQPRPPLLRAVARNSDNDVWRAITGPLPFSTRSIEFEFAEPDFTRRASLRLQTRLIGVDRDWVAASSTSRQTLTAVRDGPYIFQVRAVAETGVASDPTTFSFEVLPPWWRTMPAMMGAGLALIPLGYGSYWLRVRSLRRRNLELEEKVRRRTEELERASAAKTQFVANMSHDIRNPLNGIVGLALALEDTRLESRQREIVATLRECTTYLSTLVDDVLDFASIEAGRVELRPRPFVPHELLRSIVATLKADTAGNGALLLIEADPSLPGSILGDAGRIQQILVNYVSNALKYAGGHIRLAASIPPGSPGEIEFSVADEGPGISEEDKTTLFAKFTRLARARNSEIPGTGLGLAECRLLADIMGGSVGVESEPGRGARFFVRLPLTIAAAAPTPTAPNLPNTTVLVVEDTDYNAWAAAAVLSKLGLACERARTGAEALRMFGEKRFNVVLLDRNLPDLDGTEVARRMRQMESDGLQAVLLAVTAYCTAEDRALCLESGMDAFVGKPLTPEKLRKVLLATGRRQLAAASVHVPPEPPAVELDLSLLRYISDGSADGVETEVQRYLVKLAEAHAGVAHWEREQNLSALAKATHDLLGHARMIGAATLSETALRLELAAKSGNGPACTECLRLVDQEIRAVMAGLRQHRPVRLPA